MTDKKEEIKVDKDYLEQIKKIREYSSEQADKQIVYISGGALVFTVGFVKDIVEITPEVDKSLLLLTWLLLAIALIFNLISHRTSIISMDFELSYKYNVSDIWNNITKIFNFLSVVSLIVGIVCFITFVYLNI